MRLCILHSLILLYIMSITHQQTRRQSSSTRRPRRQAEKGSSSKRRNNYRQRGWWVKFLRSCPTWSIWAGIFVIAGLYCFLFYYFFVTPFSFRWRAIYGDPPIPEGYDIRGIDVSHYQNNVDWIKLRNASIKDAPIRFVFIKATEGENLIDPKFKEYFAYAKENYFITGAYHYYKADADPLVQAQLFINNVHLTEGDLPPVLDIEKRGRLSDEEFKNNLLSWLRTVERHYGVKPIIYTGLKFKSEYLSSPEFQPYPFWIAHYYVEKLQYDGPWVFWQHTDCGKVDGIKGFVDLNIFNGSLSELMKFTIHAKEETKMEAQ
ncbi:MAG: glycoside hydrolase family 25 protein [Bacteroidaceae bacterium]|nr:glycoside hydrolase family 25 protein [Bacteroidaceae bacterium]